MASEAPTRQDGYGYIDEVPEIAPVPVKVPLSPGSSSGSSIEEEISDGEASILSENDEEEDDEEWDAQGEDWDLATGGE